MKTAKLINPLDNVVISLDEVEIGDEVTYRAGDEARTLICRQAVSFGHKIAITNIEDGGSVIKYGHDIGLATQTIQPGDWVHIHNVKDPYEVH